LDGEIVVDKVGYSAFDDTDLEAELRARGVTTLILAGVVTYACVLATGFSAFDRGFDVLLATEAVGSWNAQLGTGTSEIVDLLLGHALPGERIELVPRRSH
jgi:nicotinamidase-related amidase